MLDVTCAIIRKGDQILAMQRGPHPTYPFKWEFPGGKLDPGETLEECILREIQEELGVVIRILGTMDFVEVQHATRGIRLFPFLAEIVEGEVALIEHNDLRWGLPAELEGLDWGEGDRRILEGLIK